jgi:hypothetical protein
MTISKVIELLESEMEESGDVELMIYDSSGDRIEPKSFSYGGMSTDKGFVDTVSFSDLE